jgi:2-polyprenyl-3-methyl-5-hydroxy-6-metoxy-1,4-benzoquinol methylase
VPDSEDICERFWNLPSKPGEEARRERLFLDDVIQKAHLEREIAYRLGGVRTLLDAGAGTGRFSIRLARQGFQVTHLDISQGMIDTARQLAQDAGILDRMRFERGRVGDLTRYENGTLDFVICCDAPISYTYPDHVRTIADLTRPVAMHIVLIGNRTRISCHSSNEAKSLDSGTSRRAAGRSVDCGVRQPA